MLRRGYSKISVSRHTMKIFLALACCVKFSSSIVAESVSSDEERRVWVKYNDGQRDAALDSMSSFTARTMPPVTIHSDFPRIGAFVVTATVDEINELANDPTIDEVSLLSLGLVFWGHSSLKDFRLLRMSRDIQCTFPNLYGPVNSKESTGK